MTQAEEETGRGAHNNEHLRSELHRIEMRIARFSDTLEQIFEEREEKERKRTEKLLEAVTEQLNRTVTGVLEGIIQKEVRTQLVQRLEKTLSAKIDQKLQELSNICAVSLSASIESKSLQHTISRAVKIGVIDAVIPSVENGMNEIRLQVLERIKKLPVHVEKSECEEISTESKEETLDNFADTLRNEENNAHEYFEDQKETVMHLLETNILECFSYAVGSEDPDLFSFFLEKIPLDAEIDLSNSLLVSFIYQLVGTLLRSGPKTQSYKTKNILLLNNSLNKIRRCKIDQKDTLLLHRCIEAIQSTPQWGYTPEEKETLYLIEKIQKENVGVL